MMMMMMIMMRRRRRKKGNAVINAYNHVVGIFRNSKFESTTK